MSLTAALLFMWSGALTRLTIPASPAVVTFGRLAVAVAVVLILAMVLRRPLRPALSRRHALLGLTLFLHFYLFTVAAQTSTIAHALSIAYTAPDIRRHRLGAAAAGAALAQPSGRRCCRRGGNRHPRRLRPR